MSDTPYADFMAKQEGLVKLAGEGIRHVRTPEGAKFFGLPIGAPISEALYQKIKSEHIAKGHKLPKGMTTKNPALVENGHVAGPNEPNSPNKPNTPPSAPKAPASPFPSAKGAPNPPAPAPAPVVEKSKPIKPTISGPNKFTVGTVSYSAPNGSRIFTPNDGSQMAYVVTPDGKVHAFNAQGEVPTTDILQKALAAKFNTSFTGDDKFAEGTFDQTTSSDLPTLPNGAELEDADGNVQFKKVGNNSWEHTGLGVKLGDADIQAFVDSGELQVAQHSDGVNNDGNLDFSSMDKPTFVSKINGLKTGDQIFYKGNPLTKQEGGTWLGKSAAAGAPGVNSEDLWWLKSNLSDDKATSRIKKNSIPNPTPLAGDQPGVPNEPNAPEVPGQAPAEEAVPGVAEPNAPEAQNPEEPTAPSTGTEVPSTKSNLPDEAVTEVETESKGSTEPKTPVVPKEEPKSSETPTASEKKEPLKEPPVPEALKEPAKKPAKKEPKLPEFVEGKKQATPESVGRMKTGDSIISKMGTIHTKNADGSFQHSNIDHPGVSQHSVSNEGDLKDSASMGNQFHHESASKSSPKETMDLAWLNNAKTGQTFTHKAADGKDSVWTKQEDGTWTNNNGASGVSSNFINKSLSKEPDKFTIGKVVEPSKEVSEPKSGSLSQDDFDKLKVGDKVTWTSPSGNGISSYEKTGPNEWTNEEGDHLLSPQFTNAINKGYLSKASTTRAAEPKVGDAVKDHPNFLENAKVGTQIGNPNAEDNIYEKQPDGTYSTPKGENFTPDQIGKSFISSGNAKIKKLGDGTTTPKPDNSHDDFIDKALPGDQIYLKDSDAGADRVFTKGVDGEWRDHPNTTLGVSNGELKSLAQYGKFKNITEKPADHTPEVGDNATQEFLDSARTGTQIHNPNGDPLASLHEKQKNGKWLSVSQGESHDSSSLISFVKSGNAKIKKIGDGTNEHKDHLLEKDFAKDAAPGDHVDVNSGFTIKTWTKQKDGTWLREGAPAVGPEIMQDWANKGLLENTKKYELPKVGEKPDSLYADQAKPGTVINFKIDASSEGTDWTKTQDGHWVSGNSVIGSEEFGHSLDTLKSNASIKSEPGSKEEVPEIDTSDLPKVGEKVTKLEHLDKFLPGTALNYAKKDGSQSKYVKLENGDWLGPGGGQFPSKVLSPNVKSGKFSVASTPELTPKTPEDLDLEDEKNLQFLPGGKAYSKDDLAEALHALDSHTSFQVAYGLKSVPDNNVAKNQNELKEASASAFPNLKPKPAAIAYLKKMLGIEEGTDDSLDNGPKLKIFAGDQTHEFSQSEIQKAVNILQDFPGKTYQSQLKLKGSPLGDVKWNDAVGFHKDKLEGKQAVIDLLQSKLAGDAKSAYPDDKLTSVDIKNQPVGAKIFYANGGEGEMNNYEIEKIGPDHWKVDGSNHVYEDSSWNAAANAGYITQVSTPQDLPSYAQTPVAEQNKMNPDDINDPNVPGSDKPLPGKYLNEQGTALIVHGDGTGTLVGKDGVSVDIPSKATQQLAKDKSMSYKGVSDGPVPLKPIKPKPKPKSTEEIADGTYFGGNPNLPKTWVYEVKGDDVKVYKPKSSTENSTKKIGGNTDASWIDNATTGAKFQDKYGYGAKPTYTLQPNGVWTSSSTGEPIDPGVLSSAKNTYYSYKILSHGTGEPTKLTKAKLNGLFQQGKLNDADGNSVVPNGHSGSVTLFGGETNIPTLLKAKEILDKYDPENSTETTSAVIKEFQAAGIHPDLQVVKKYALDHFGENNNGTTIQALKVGVDNLVDGLDTTPPETDVPDIFKWDDLGQAVYPAELTSMNPYSITEYNKFIDTASKALGDGKVIGLHKNKMNKYEKSSWVANFKNGNFAALYNLESEAAAKDLKTHAAGYLHPGYEGNEPTNKITWGAAVPGEISAGTAIPGDWSNDPKLASPEEIDNYLISAHMQNPMHLTSAEKRTWMSYHKTGNKFTVDQLSVTAQQRKLDGKEPLSQFPQWTDPADIKIAKSYDHLFDDNPNPTNGWTGSGYGGLAESYGSAPDYLKDNSDNVELQNLYNENLGKGNSSGTSAVQAVVQYFQNKADKEATKALIPVYTLKPHQNVGKSTHPVFEYGDQFGNNFFFKPRSNTKLDKYRSEVEHFGNQFGKFFGFNSADSQLVTLDGKYGQLQKDVGGVTDMMNSDYGSLTPKQVADIGKEHLLDWFLDNDDTHGANMKLMQDGHVVGIDKGRAFKHYGAWNGFDGTHNMDSNAQTVYAKLYDAIREGKVSKEDADKAYLDVRKRAIQMSKKSDDDISAMLDEAMANRDQFDNSYTIDGKKVPNSLAGLKAAVLDRKSKLPEQTDTLWKKIYKDAGYGDLPEPTTSLGEGFHHGLDDADLHDTVLKVNQHGKATNLGGNDFLDNSALFWADHNEDGSKNVNMEAFLTPAAQEGLLDWLKVRATDVGPNKSDPSGIASHDIYGQPMINAAKTINHHSADGAYNQEKLDAFNESQELLHKDLDAWSPSLSSNTEDNSYLFPSGQKIPMNQVDQYKMMLDYYSDKAPAVQNAQTNSTKAGIIDKYNPVALGKPPAVYQSDDGEKLTKLADGSWIYNDGKTLTVLDPVKGTDMSLGSKFHELVPDENEKNNDVKVLYGTTHDLQGFTDSEGNLHYSDTKLANGVSGSEYDVILPSGEHIFFRNAGSTSTLKTQAGKLSVRIEGVKEGSETQSAMQRVMQQLESMGLDVSPADHTSAENAYWHQMSLILTNRKHEAGSNWAKAAVDVISKKNELKSDNAKFLTDLSKSMGQEDENQWWRDLWSKHFGTDKVQNLIDSEGYLPKYEHLDLKNPTEGTGQPYWDRFDVSDDDLKGAKKYLVSSFYSDDSPSVVVDSGAALSTEQRLHYYGKFSSKMSSSSDQGVGSGDTVFTRIQSKSALLNNGGYNVVYNKNALKKTKTYSYPDDTYGNVNSKSSSAPSNPMNALKSFTGGTNETMLPSTASLLDGIELLIYDSGTEADRNAAIQKLKSMGIHNIRGLKVEERLVMRGQLSEALQKLEALES